MRGFKELSSSGVRLALTMVVLTLLVVPAAFADVVARPFQFSDQFYLQNGVDPTKTLDHFVFPDAKFPECTLPDGGPAPPCRTRSEQSPNPAKWNNVRVVETTGGFKHNGNLLYYMAHSFFMPSSFTNNAAGDNARAICNAFRAFLFPKQNGDPLSPAPPNRRQDNIFQTNNGYWSNNPLGCWRLAFVSWDGPNVNSSKCQDLNQDLIERNGPDTDGTGLIRTLSEINGGVADGCLRIRLRAEDGSNGFPWVA